MVGYAPCYGLSDPPMGVSRELEALGWVKLLDGSDHACDPLGNEICKLNPSPQILSAEGEDCTPFGMIQAQSGDYADSCLNVKPQHGAVLFYITPRWHADAQSMPQSAPAFCAVNDD